MSSEKFIIKNNKRIDIIISTTNVIIVVIIGNFENNIAETVIIKIVTIPSTIETMSNPAKFFAPVIKFVDNLSDVLPGNSSFPLTKFRRYSTKYPNTAKFKIGTKNITPPIRTLRNQFCIANGALSAFCKSILILN